MINIFVIDDKPIIIDTLKSIFSDGKDQIKITGSANSAEEALPKLKQSNASIVILDLLRPGLSGVEFCVMLKDKFPQKKIIVFTGDFNTAALYDTWINGADAILMKYCGKDELVNTIHSVFAGDRILGTHVPEFRDLLPKSNSNILTLMPTEQKILNLLAEGKSRKKAAKLLGSSLSVVDFHCKNIFTKFNKTNLQSVLIEARKAKLIN